MNITESNTDQSTEPSVEYRVVTESYSNTQNLMETSSNFSENIDDIHMLDESSPQMNFLSGSDVENDQRSSFENVEEKIADKGMKRNTCC